MRWVIGNSYVKHDDSAKKHPFPIYTHFWSEKNNKKYNSFNFTSKYMLINNVFWTAIWDVIKKMYMICATLETWMVSNFKNHARSSVILIYNNNRALIFDSYSTITIILSRVVWTDIISNFIYAAKRWFNCLICAC